MSAERGDPNFSGNRPLFLSAGGPNLGCQNLAGTVAAGDSSPITSPTLSSACSTSVLNTMHESFAPQAALSSPMSLAAEHAGPSIQPSWNVPAGCTQVPISILVFHRRLTGRGSRPQMPLSNSCMPAPALPGVSEDSEEGASIQLAGSNFLLHGRTSNIVAGNMAMDPSQQATPDKYKSEHGPIHLRLNGLDDETSKTGNVTEASRLQGLATIDFCDSRSYLDSVIPANTLETLVRQSQESTAPLAEGSSDDNMHMYQPMQKRSKTQINQIEHTPLSTPAVLREKTLTEIEMQIAAAEKTETFMNEETPARKLKTRRKKHRPKVIREDRQNKVQKSVHSTTDGKSPNQKVKRSYVRKKRNLSSLEKCSGPFSDQSISGGSEIADRSRSASVRRSLRFESEEQGIQGDHSSTANSHCHNYEKPVHGQNSFCSVTESEVQIGHGLQVDMENSPGGLAFGMSLKLNKLLDEYIHLPEVTPKPTQEVSNATSGSFSCERAREQDNVGRTREPDTTSNPGLCIEERAGMTVIEGNKKELELNCSTDGFVCSARYLPEMDSTRSQISEVSTVENHRHLNDGESSLTATRDSIILSTAVEMVAFCQAGGIKKKRSARIRRNSFVSITDLEKNTLQASTRLPPACTDALYESSYIKFMTKKRSQKAWPHCPNSIQPNMELKNRLSAGSIFYGESNGSKISEEAFQKSSPQTMDNKRINLDIHCKVPEGSSANTSTVPYMDYLQVVASKLKHLDLNTEQVQTEMHLSQTTPAVISFGGTDCLSNALVPYGGRVVVPYERPLQLVKRQRPRAKVDLDFETTRVWNLLMGKAAEPVDGNDVEKERWWQQEREVFQGRANSFIARMRLVQGDRRFSPWKGSVVDSVVGVFLTQNVADHLSSSAYMTLASSFPSRSVNSNCKDDTTTQDNEQTISTSALGEKSMFDLFHDGARPDLGVSCEELSMVYEKIHMEPKDKSANASVCNHQGTGIEHKAQQFPDFSSVELAASTGVLQQIQFQNEISASQSVISENLQSRLSLSSGIPRNFVVGDSAAAYQQLESNIGHGKPLTGNGATTSEQFPDFSSVELAASTGVLQQIQFQNEISASQSVISENLQSRLSLSSGIPRNFVVGDSAAAYQQLESNIGHGKPLTGNGATTSEIECQSLKTAAINDDGIGKPGIPSSFTMPFISIVDPQQLHLRNGPNVSSTSPRSSSGSASPNLKDGTIEKKNPDFMPFDSHVAEMNGNKTSGATLNSPKKSTELPVKLHHDKRTTFEASDLQEHESLFVTGEMTAEATRKQDECTLKSGFTSYNGVPDTAAQASRPKKRRTTSKKNTENFDWDTLRRWSCCEGNMKERSFERKDSVDWEAVRCADVQRISHAIRERGMNNVLAERIQSFLNRLVRDHGSIDLEWLRDIPPDSAKDYLLSIRGLGLKSVECVRLLTLHHLAFPVDTNVGRICVRLGWVPIQPLPESLQLHLLELYPVLETIQKYLWPRLCKLDQQTLYELHYQMITFGKVFCTKSKPNCNACPMRSECKHFASAFANARLALPAPQEKCLVKSSNQFAFPNSSMHNPNSTDLPRLEGSIHARDFLPMNSEPIIEEPASPREEECPETMGNDIEDFYEDGEIPTIRLNMEAFAQNLENCIKESNTELHSDDIAKALVAISTEAASIPVPKLKNVHRLRTEHYVYELPDSHPLIQQLGLDQREPDDPSPYLLAIWTPGEIKEISKAPKPCCDFQMESGLCNNEMCHNCIAEQENQSRYVRGTILVPCRTAMRGSFPLNGTYFQVNEVFADHESSHNPIHVERKQLWNLQRRMVFFGTSVPTIFKGLTTEEIQQCFWRGFVCVRGFDMETRAPRPLCPHLHVVARPRSRKTAATEQVL
ncbi:protein ROS1C-like [Phragmites australis]|uniref:protein ROS1C-like n=1 Tax=Phragmites australis TaxID=29695 RepID=UPI002D76ED78|nr:protein ROS1C-like [Phragmites australis]